MVVDPEAIRLRTFEGKLLEPPIDGVGDTVRQLLSFISGGDLVHHRFRLVDQEEKARWVVSADFCVVRH
jgi:hypothetical protein